MSKKQRIIYLDMDGVLANFTLAALNLFEVKGHIIEHIYDTWPLGKRVNDLIGVDKNDFWVKINEKGPTWWSGMRPYVWADRLVRLVDQLGKVMILSSPSRGGDSAAGKLIWIERHFTTLSREFVLTPKKHKPKLARPGDILIDDTAETCQAWHNAGGEAILFPRPWNGHPDWKTPISVVERQLKEHTEIPD